jgi:hypothetical protein
MLQTEAGQVVAVSYHSISRHMVELWYADQVSLT